jgi:hypothetical protein
MHGFEHKHTEQVVIRLLNKQTNEHIGHQNSEQTSKQTNGDQLTDRRFSPRSRASEFRERERERERGTFTTKPVLFFFFSSGFIRRHDACVALKVSTLDRAT